MKIYSNPSLSKQKIWRENNNNNILIYLLLKHKNSPEWMLGTIVLDPGWITTPDWSKRPNAWLQKGQVWFLGITEFLNFH